MIKLISYQTTTILPDPNWSNSEALTNDINICRSINGTVYTYIKNKDRHKLIFAFNLTEQKAQELRAFLYTYISCSITLIDHNNNTWVGVISSNPFELSASGLTIRNITLEFEGIKQ